MRNWHPERSTNLSNVTWIGSGGARIQPQAVWLQSPWKLHRICLAQNKSIHVYWNEFHDWKQNSEEKDLGRPRSVVKNLAKEFCRGAVEMKPTKNHEVADSIPGLAQWVKHCCGVGRRLCSDPVLLWLWRRPAATVLIRPLAWEPTCAATAALKKKILAKNLNLFFLNFVCVCVCVSF